MAQTQGNGYIDSDINTNKQESDTKKENGDPDYVRYKATRSYSSSYSPTGDNLRRRPLSTYGKWEKESTSQELKTLKPRSSKLSNKDKCRIGFLVIFILLNATGIYLICTESNEVMHILTNLKHNVVKTLFIGQKEVNVVNDENEAIKVVKGHDPPEVNIVPDFTPPKDEHTQSHPEVKSDEIKTTEPEVSDDGTVNSPPEMILNDTKKTTPEVLSAETEIPEVEPDEIKQTPPQVDDVKEASPEIVHEVSTDITSKEMTEDEVKDVPNEKSQDETSESDHEEVKETFSDVPSESSTELDNPSVAVVTEETTGIPEDKIAIPKVEPGDTGVESSLVQEEANAKPTEAQEEETKMNVVNDGVPPVDQKEALEVPLELTESFVINKEEIVENASVEDKVSLEEKENENIPTQTGDQEEKAKEVLPVEELAKVEQEEVNVNEPKLTQTGVVEAISNALTDEVQSPPSVADATDSDAQTEASDTPENSQDEIQDTLSRDKRSLDLPPDVQDTPPADERNVTPSKTEVEEVKKVPIEAVKVESNEVEKVDMTETAFLADENQPSSSEVTRDNPSDGDENIIMGEKEDNPSPPSGSKSA